MERHVLILAAAAGLLAMSCGSNSTYVEVVKGNYYFGRGLYQPSVVSYLKALDAGKYPEWIRYNLGNVYHSLGESDAALSMWKATETADSLDLRFNTAFNRGTLYYELGKYREAFEEFRHALEIDPSRIEAKINLEITLKKIGSGGSQGQGRQDPAAQKTETSDRVLDFIKKKEATRWAAQDRIDLEEGKDDW